MGDGSPGGVRYRAPYGANKSMRMVRRRRRMRRLRMRRGCIEKEHYDQQWRLVNNCLITQCSELLFSSLLNTYNIDVTDPQKYRVRVFQSLCKFLDFLGGGELSFPSNNNILELHGKQFKQHGWVLLHLAVELWASQVPCLLCHNLQHHLLQKRIIDILS